MAMSRKGICILLLTGVVLLAGCAPNVQSGFLSGYDQLHSGRYLEKYWSSGDLNREISSKIYVEPIKSMVTDQPGVTAADACNWLRAGVMSNIRNKPGWSTEEGPQESKSKLVLAITCMTPGSAAGRIFAGELLVGHAFVCVEGKLIDSATGKEVAAFTDRRRDSGAIGFEDLAGDAGPKLVKRMVDNIAADIVKELFEDAENRH